MTDQRANGKSFSQKEIDSPLTVGDLIAVLNSIFGQDISNRVMAAATASQATEPCSPNTVVDTQAPLTETEAAANKGTQDNGTQDTGTLPTAVSQDAESQPAVDIGTQVATQPALQADSTLATRWYAVTVGKEVGVFTNWNVVAPLVISVSGACYPRYPSRQAAEAAFKLAIENGSVRRIV